MLHHIRRTILDMLATAESLRYGQLKPKELDGNVFTYHLKGLISDKLIQKNVAGDYCLTHKGRDYIVHRYEDSAYSAHVIFLIVLQRNSEYLLRRRKVQPLLGYTGFIHGEPIAGEDILQTAGKRLENKTGISGVELTIVGSAMITQYRNEELQSFSHAIIVSGKTEKDIAIKEDATGENFWSELSRADTILPSCFDIVRMIESKQTWLEATYDLSQMDVR
ncbi:MAG TPA: hypothetical protein PKD15_02950 [Candidatus Saccharibacteria bacterium]|nr:hypothetical protein [Candidatus Saccharibacteria bacterium]